LELKLANKRERQLSLKLEEMHLKHQDQGRFPLWMLQVGGQDPHEEEEEAEDEEEEEEAAEVAELEPELAEAAEVADDTASSVWPFLPSR